MNAREKYLVGAVGIVLLGSIAFNMFKDQLTSQSFTEKAGGWNEANRLLQTENNIRSRNQAVEKRLRSLRSKFLVVGDPEQSQIVLLQEIEKLARRVNLSISQKNTIYFSDSVIGVSLEGKTNSEGLFRFMFEATKAEIALKINRLQIHANPENNLLNYRIVLETMLIEKKGI